MLFYGPPGTGKTSTILAVAKMIYSPKEFNSMVLEVRYHTGTVVVVVACCKYLVPLVIAFKWLTSVTSLMLTITHM